MADAATKRREERVKLAASAVSNVGVAFLVAGWVGPSITGRLNLDILAGSALLGFSLHIVGQCILHYVVADSPRDVESGDEQ